MPRVTLASGESPDVAWLKRLCGALPGVRLDVVVEPRFLYSSELADPPSVAELVPVCSRLLESPGGGGTVLWAHNLGLGRNGPLARAWAEAAVATGTVFLSHHHDFFFDNRWGRWPELRRAGAAFPDDAARWVFPAGPGIMHIAINGRDHALLGAGHGARALWWPNPVTPPRHGAGQETEARRWLAGKTGHDDPYWLVPCRLLRRKNLAESLLLARWLLPGTRVVTTGAPTSRDEESYAASLGGEARRCGWPLDLSVLAGAEDAPPVSALLAGAEGVLLNSLQEGFGLPYLEAAAAERPLLARALPNVLPDLLAMGLEVPDAYDEILIPPDGFDIRAECVRQEKLWQVWCENLPDEVRDMAGRPPLLSAAGDNAVAFSRLTMTAQLEVLASGDDALTGMLDAANPALAGMRGAERQHARLGEEAGRLLSPARVAENFREAVEQALRLPSAGEDAPVRTMQGFLRDRLAGPNLYPLLFTPQT